MYNLFKYRVATIKYNKLYVEYDYEVEFESIQNVTIEVL